MENPDTKTCAECGQDWPLDRYNADSRSPDTCFKCRSGSINLGFGGYRQQWHNSTIKESQNKTIREARANGLDPVPAWTTTYTGPAKL